MGDDVVVTRNADQNRWEARLDGELAGFAEYRLTNESVTFTHTEVDPAFEGRGVGGTLVRAALDEVSAEGTRSVRPVCPFVRDWISEHPDYQSLLTDGRPRARTD